MPNSLGLQHQIRRFLASGSFSDWFPITDKGGFDTEFDPILAAVEFRIADDFVYYNRYGQKRTIPKDKIDTSRIYPVFVWKIDSATLIPEGDILGYIAEVEA